MPRPQPVPRHPARRRVAAPWLAAVLWAAAAGSAGAQSTASPPPTSPTAPQLGAETQAQAPGHPGTALPPAGGGAPARPGASGTTPLKGDTTPPGITKAGQ